MVLNVPDYGSRVGLYFMVRLLISRNGLLVSRPPSGMEPPVCHRSARKARGDLLPGGYGWIRSSLRNWRSRLDRGMAQMPSGIHPPRPASNRKSGPKAYTPKADIRARGDVDGGASRASMASPIRGSTGPGGFMRSVPGQQNPAVSFIDRAGRQQLGFSRKGVEACATARRTI